MNNRWMRLDNAALIFPAIRSARWVNTFRVSVTLRDPVDPALLQRAVEDLRPRFPSLYLRLGTGLFWYFLEQIREVPRVRPDFAYPLTHMDKKEQRRCCFRVFYFQNRIAVEFFHVLTDGTGGMIYLKSLTARYLELAHGITVPKTHGVLSAADPPRQEELRDDFQYCSGEYASRRKESTAYRLTGTHDPTGFMHLITGVIHTPELVAAAHRYHATVTVFLAAVMARTVAEMQAERRKRARFKPVNITLPINLRRVFGTETLRNFALVLNVGADFRLKDYTVEELCLEFQNQMDLEITPEKLRAEIAANVQPQRVKLMRLTPLFLKNLVLRGVYSAVGESRGCLNISNLGRVEMPPAAAERIRRFEFIIGVQFTYPNNCSVVSFGDTTCINMIRNIRETELERRFFSKLVELGVPVLIESNEGVETECTV